MVFLNKSSEVLKLISIVLVVAGVVGLQVTSTAHRHGHSKRRAHARGAKRRGVLTEAAVDLFLEQGLAALNHRAVAARAGLPLASIAYYFASADDLRDEALQHVATSWAATAAAGSTRRRPVSML